MQLEQSLGCNWSSRWDATGAAAGIVLDLTANHLSNCAILTPIHLGAVGLKCTFLRQHKTAILWAIALCDNAPKFNL